MDETVRFTIVERPELPPWRGRGRGKWDQVFEALVETARSGRAVCVPMNEDTQSVKRLQNALRKRLNAVGLHARYTKNGNGSITCWAEEMTSAYLERGMPATEGEK